MSSTFNGHIPPEIEPHTAHLAGDHPRPECTFSLINKSAWPIVYKVKVQHSILSLSTVLPAHGIVAAGSSAVISLKFELQKMREMGLDLSRGHRIHVDSWYISNEDASRSDSAKLLSAIKSRVNNPRKPDTSTLRIQYVSSAGSSGPSRQGTLPSIPQTTRQPPTPRSMTTPYPYQPPPPAASLATPAINIIPPTRQQTLASNADSPTHPISSSHPTSTYDQIACYVIQSEAPTLRRTRSSSSTVADSASMRTTSSRPSIPIPGRKGNTSPKSSVAGSFISARERNGDPDGPSCDDMDVDQPTGGLVVEEPATLKASAEPSISPTMRQLPFAEPTARPNPSWTAYKPAGVSSSVTHLSPNRGGSPDSAEPDWMNYLAVDRKLVGKVKKPQGTPFACGGFSDVFKCEVRFDAPDDGNPKMVAVKVLRPVGLDGYSESESLQRMIARASREAHAWLAIYHPNVVPLVGYTFTPLLSLVSPWHERGNIRSYLNLNPDADRMKLVLDIAKGLAYLHSRNPPVVHGDIKPENILINDKGDALIMDFGLAMVMEANPWYSSSHREAGSLRWLAPELLLNAKETRSCSSDVYSYGGVALEVITSELPHLGRSDVEISLAICDPKTPKDPFDQWAKYPQVPEEVKEMIVKCWSRRAEKRPTMRGIEERLGKLVP